MLSMFVIRPMLDIDIDIDTQTLLPAVTLPMSNAAPATCNLLFQISPCGAGHLWGQSFV
jgi:hypothetical protein